MRYSAFGGTTMKIRFFVNALSPLLLSSFSFALEPVLSGSLSGAIVHSQVYFIGGPTRSDDVVNFQYNTILGTLANGQGTGNPDTDPSASWPLPTTASPNVAFQSNGWSLWKGVMNPSFPFATQTGNQVFTGISFSLEGQDFTMPQIRIEISDPIGYFNKVVTFTNTTYFQPGAFLGFRSDGVIIDQMPGNGNPQLLTSFRLVFPGIKMMVGTPSDLTQAYSHFPGWVIAKISLLDEGGEVVFEQTSTQLFLVPEPGTCTLIALGSLLGLSGRRRKSGSVARMRATAFFINIFFLSYSDKLRIINEWFKEKMFLSLSLFF